MIILTLVTDISQKTVFFLVNHFSNTIYATLYNIDWNIHYTDSLVTFSKNDKTQGFSEKAMNLYSKSTWTRWMNGTVFSEYSEL